MLIPMTWPKYNEYLNNHKFTWLNIRVNWDLAWIEIWKLDELKLTKVFGILPRKILSTCHHLCDTYGVSAWVT